MKKQNRGITLVALVITIIVLIILAGVSINAIMNDGLITNAKDAKNEWQEKTAIEKIELAKLELKTVPEIKAGQSAGDSNKRYTEGVKTAIIPSGFTVSKLATEDSITEGLVIYSNKSNNAGITETADVYMSKIGKDEAYTEEILKQTYNQYVWIPVDNPSDMYGTVTEDDITLNPNKGLVVGEKYGKLYNANAEKTELNVHLNWPSEASYSNISYKEPSILDYPDLYEEESELKIEEEFTNMITSVEACKGFYIGRYELTGTKENPTLLKNNNPLINGNWYDLYTGCKNLELENSKVRTTMVWGSQWDQAIKTILDKVPNFLTNADLYGWHWENADFDVQQTGTSTSSYNIYDMGGNVWDWTLEYSDINARTLRGGDCCEDADAIQASARSKIGVLSQSYGCRAQLYITL